MASQIADQNLPKSRRQQKEEAAGPQHSDYVPPLKDNNLKRKRAEEEAEKDPKLQEFLHVMQAPSKNKSWANETPIGGRPMEDTAAVEPVAVPEDESDNEYQVIEKKAKTSHATVSTPVAPAVPVAKVDDTPMDEAPGNLPEKSEQEPEDATVAAKAAVSDADWLRSHTNRVLDLVEDDEESPRPTSDVPPQPAQVPVQDDAEPEKMVVDQPEQSAAANNNVTTEPATEVDKVRQTGRLYLRNLHFDVTSDDLREHFSKYGLVEEVSHCNFLILFICYDEYP